MCPSNLQEPHGKKIPISVVGPVPYVILNDDQEWIGGAEFQIVDIFAKKFGFTPNFKMAPSTQYAVQQVHQKDTEIAIGQIWYHNFFGQLIEYLPSMYVCTFLVQSQKPTAIISYDTLSYPFDKYLWYMTILFSTSVFILLIFIQKCWIHATMKKSHNEWIFEGII